MDKRLPADFEWGLATSAWQIEGDSAGRGPSTWDAFAAEPGRIVDGATADPACDHVRRVEEDLDLMAWMGLDAYRFSISWPRVMPNGAGEVSVAGLDFYDRLVDGLLARNIRPVATLYHWDLPLTLEQAGGWPIRDTAQRFADYAQVVGERLADRVDRWATLNEPWCTAFLGYCAGYFAPGRQEPGASLAAAYHLMLGHGLAVQRLRAAGARNVGIALNIIPIIADDPSMQAAAEHVDRLQNGIFLDLLTGRGIDQQLRHDTASLTDWSCVQAEDRHTMAAPLDWVGENYYTVMRIAPESSADSDAIGQDASMFPASPPLSFAPRPPFTDMGWEVAPEGLGIALRRVAKDLPGIPIWVCENGAAVSETDDVDGIHDPLRIEYLEQHIDELGRCRDAGVDVRGYFGWSLLDNLEWASGWTKRFGLVRVDPVTSTRTPKDSAYWYRDLITIHRARRAAQ